MTPSKNFIPSRFITERVNPGGRVGSESGHTQHKYPVQARRQGGGGANALPPPPPHGPKRSAWKVPKTNEKNAKDESVLLICQ